MKKGLKLRGDILRVNPPIVDCSTSLMKKGLKLSHV